MLSAERYMALLNHFVGPAPREQEEYEVALEELTRLFHCTERNVKLIVRKLQDEHWIEWLPGRGRGNKSKIRFLVKRDLFLLEYAKRLTEKGEYRSAFEFLYQHEEDRAVLDQFLQWLNGQFGMEKIGAETQAKDVFRLPVYRAPLTLDPSKLYFGFDSHLVRQCFDRLMEYDSEQQRIKPMLAHHWESDDSGSLWTFYLRKGVLFHHGKVLTAEDVVYTLERLRSETMNAWMMETMESVTAIDSRTVRIALRQPNWLFPRLLCSSCASIIPSDLSGLDESSFWRLPSGTGPFRITHWGSNGIELEVHARYFLGRPYLDGVKLIFMPENIPNLSRLKWEQLIANDARVPADAGGDWQRIETLSQGCSLISWNRNKGGPQESLSFRQAVNLIIDRSDLIRSTGRPGYPARGFLPTEEAAFGYRRPDPEAAKQLLAQSGYDGSPIRLIASEAERDEAEWIARQCASIGIPVEIRCGDRGMLARIETAQEADAQLICLVFADDEICELESLLQQNSVIFQHLAPGLRRWIDQVVNDIYASPSKEKRRALLEQIEIRLQEEAQILFLVHRQLNTYVHPSVRGIVINNLGWMDFKNIWLTTAEKPDAAPA